MVKRYGFHIVFVVLLIVLGWQIMDLLTAEKVEPISPLEVSLQLAGDNRYELEKVLRYYQKNPSDSLKYKAACFLIENLPYYKYSTGEQLENYKMYYVWLKTYPKRAPEEIADSVKKVFGPIGQLEKKCDVMEVDSAYLCNNIEWAFKVWQEQPWNKHVTFDAFCEYILPYRIDDEPLTYWREEYYEKYNPLLDSLRMSDKLDKENPIVAANYLISRLPDKFRRNSTVAPYPFGHIGPKFVPNMTGTCRDRTDFGMYLLRALGIPCAIDFILGCDLANAGHFWLIAWDQNGRDCKTEFPGSFVYTCKDDWYNNDDAVKVYRSTFSVNRELYNEMAELTLDLYPFWKLPKFKDVTYSYARYYMGQLRIPSSKIDKDKAKGKIAYLCITDRDRWVPVDWTEYDANKLEFRDIRKGAVLRVGTYEKGKLSFITDPFYIDRMSNKLHFYSCEDETEDVVLYAKFPIEKENLFRERLIGGVFEGSNKADFSEKDTLFMIQSKPNRMYTSVKSWSNKKYRYIRYYGYKKTHCQIAEIAFYNVNDTVPLKGNPIGTSGCYQQDGSHEYPNAFDGQTWTCFDYLEEDGGWTGLDLGEPMQVDRIVYTPANRDNYIRPGDLFELSYCDGDWKSAGKIKATTDSLVYRNVPRNAVLLLRNLTRGIQERIFVYENGRQAWK